MSNPNEQIKICDYLFRWLEKSLDPAEERELKQYLETDPDALELYISMADLYASLSIPNRLSFRAKEAVYMQMLKELGQDEVQAEAIALPKQEAAAPAAHQDTLRPSAGRKEISKFSIFSIVTAAAASIFFAAFIWLVPPRSDLQVATLTHSIHAKWADTDMSIQPETRLYADRTPLLLREGWVQIRFDSGADVIVEGPAQMQFLSRNSMRLTQGKVLAHVGREATGFIVRTPGGIIKDIGTEFGVHVQPSGLSDVQVYSGEIHVYPGSGDRFIRMFNGEAKSLHSDGALQDIPFQPVMFVRHEEMNAQVQSPQNDYYRWKAAVLNLHRDPSLVAHYFYEPDDQAPHVLVNAAPAASDGTNGRFGDVGRNAPQWVPGRWRQKQAVRFERGKNQCILIDADRSLSLNGPLTISTWVYYPDARQKGGHLISCRDGYHVNYQFSFFDDKYCYPGQFNKLEFLRFTRKESGAYSQPFVQEAGRWYHMAVIYDGQLARFYVNGEMFESIPYEKAVDSRETSIVLGAMKIAGKYVLPEGDFDGVVDELMIFDRSMSESEIKAIYESGLPDAPIGVQTANE